MAADHQDGFQLDEGIFFCRIITLVMSNTPSEYYFRFGSAILQNGRQYVIRRLWPVSSPHELEFHAGDAQNADGKLLPV